ncbi:MAG: DUF3179 domain-containing protein [Gammaproteobacteria bacterium]|nr:DUF3179 domain-containing protein [Gammaproteobacteria bacterium]
MYKANPTIIQGKWTRWVIYPLVLIAVVIIWSGLSFSTGRDNDFDLRDTLIPRDEIYHGGPPRDGIPAIERPRFVQTSQVGYLKDDDRILGLVYAGVARAYPIKILNYHEIVNDRVNGQPVLITYCPLCGSGMAFQPEMKGETSFGVSGLLYNSDMLLYDRETESLWSQIMATAISGPLKGNKLKTLVLNNTTWSHWKKQHPDSEVLSTDTGYWRNYSRHPYGDYDLNKALYFPVSNTSARYHPKERVIGLTLGEQAKAYPVSELEKKGQTSIIDRFAGQQLTIKYDAASQSASIYDDKKQPIPSTTLFWFAWVAFYPDTEVYTSK